MFPGKGYIFHDSHPPQGLSEARRVRGPDFLLTDPPRGRPFRIVVVHPYEESAKEIPHVNNNSCLRRFPGELLPPHIPHGNGR